MTVKITGSKSLSEIARECGASEGEFTLTIRGNASLVAGSVKAGTVRLGAADFALALAGAGAVGEALMMRAVEFAAARAEGRAVSDEVAAAAAKLSAKAERWQRTLPPNCRRLNPPQLFASRARQHLPRGIP